MCICARARTHTSTYREALHGLATERSLDAVIFDVGDVVPEFSHLLLIPNVLLLQVPVRVRVGAVYQYIQCMKLMHA